MLSRKNCFNYSPLINSLFWIYLIFCGAKGTSIVKDPPRLQSNEQKSLQVARLGQEFRLNCPVEGDPPLMVDWYKDGEPITPAWSRFAEKSLSKTLRIRSVHAEDSGLYECKAVNGFGSQIAKIRVLVVEDAFVLGAELKGNLLDNSSGAMIRKRLENPSSFSATPALPQFSPETLEQATSPIHLSSGNTIRLRCDAKGTPAPRVTWFKDGKAIGDKMWRWSTWTLVLTKLTAEDSGAYECIASNTAGKTEFTVQLHVAELLEKRRPELASGFPNNMSVLAGNEAILECIVRSGFSTMPPHIKWLKRVPEEQATGGKKTLGGINNRHNKYRLLPVENTHVLVIQETHDEGIRINETQRNGTFVSKLIISRTQVEDDGNYLCLATNSQGYTFKEARLTVLAGAEIISSSTGGLPLPLIIIGLSIPCTLLVVGSVCFALRRHHERMKKQTKSLSPRKVCGPPSHHSTATSSFHHHHPSQVSYEQRQLLVSTTSTHSHSSSSSSGGGGRGRGSYLQHHCQSLQKPGHHPVIEIAMSRCSCCGGDQSSSEASAPSTRPPLPPRTYEQCYNNSFVGSTSHSLHCGHWT